MKALDLYGCGGHARSVADVAIELGYESLLFIDDAARPGETIFSHPVVTQPAPDRSADAIVAIGDNALRQLLFEKIEKQLRISLTASDAYIADSAALQSGCFVGHHAYIGPHAAVGVNCIINTGSIIEHETIVGAHSHVAVNATIAGRCRIGASCLIGASATVLDGVSICDNAIIGAGAVVVDIIDSPGIYVGVPARKIRQRLNP